MLLPDSDLHIGILLALFASAVIAFALWRTPFGFGVRVLGASDQAARYAGISTTRVVLSVMAIAGAVAGMAGGVEVLGVQSRLIEGFSVGFGFKAVAVALLGGLDPLAVIPAGLFFGFVEAGALAMQRGMGIPSSLVDVIQGLTMAFVLCARSLDRRPKRV
jgi:simple sugar transport system permease protein